MLEPNLKQSVDVKWSPLLATLLCCLLWGCTQHHALQSPGNPSGKQYGTPEQAGEVLEQAAPASTVFASNLNCQASATQYAPRHYRVDSILTDLKNTAPAHHSGFNQDMALSPGDIIELQIENGEGFSGRYVLNPRGVINLPMVRPINLRGMDSITAAEKIELALVRGEIFQPATAAVHVHVLEWSEIDVTVLGAVFQPGRQYINSKTINNHIVEKMTAFGDYSNTRMLSEALRAASGIRPDAKIDQVILVRNGWQVELDMSGIFTGQSVTDVPLIAGDQIVVPSTGCFQRHLVRPSQITPKGFRVFMSNLIKPAESNSNAAVGRFSSNLPYGSRLLQAAVSANCVGGTQWTNAPRKVVLASNNPLTGQYQVIERSVEELMRQAHDETANPYLMPNDAVACYDSDVTNLRDVARTVMEVLVPVRAL
ncbi:MAG: polysaccharide biosynthesis/export family protein [Pseudomonadota bacterium]|nr:polysaccharide biosynthesis/export family protein [Pseudomonadota bacterium]